MSPSEKRPNPVWRFFRSIRLTIVLLVLLALASVAGTLLPQQQDLRELAQTLNPTLFAVFRFLDLSDMYHSVWFRLLIAGLALNLIICSLDRFPKAWTLFKASPRPARERLFEDLSPDQCLVTSESVEKALGGVHRILKRRFRRIVIQTERESTFFYAEKGRYSHFGAYAVHLSVLLILVGALLGSFLGFEAYVNIVEGEEVNRTFLRKQMKPVDLGFSVRCDRFSVEFYENGAPKEYRSDVTFLVHGRPVENRSIRVNHPVEFKEITFYQSSYGKVAGKTVGLRLLQDGKEGKGISMVVEAEKAVSLPGGEGSFLVLDVREDIMGMGPAVFIAVHPEKAEEVRFWIFKNPDRVRNALPEPMARSSKFDPSAFKPYTFVLETFESRFYTGLQVNKDPGVALVWAGCFAMIGGLFVTFFTSHGRIWVRVRKERQGTEIRFAGTSNKNPVGLERDLGRLGHDLQEILGG